MRGTGLRRYIEERKSFNRSNDATDSQTSEDAQTVRSGGDSRVYYTTRQNTGSKRKVERHGASTRLQ